VRGSNVLASEIVEICRLRAEGKSVDEVCARTGRSRATVDRAVARAGGLPPRRAGRSAVALSAGEREEISRDLKSGHSFRAIATKLRRAPTTVSREVGANGGPTEYRAWAGEQRAYESAARPKERKLVDGTRLFAVVKDLLAKKWSPVQIEQWLQREYPDDAEMRVSHETIYQSIYVQTRGELRKQLASYLRSGRTRRQPHALTRAQHGSHGRLRDMVNISQRPAEVEDRAVPGHYEGDLIVGAYSRSAIGVLVERTSRYVVLIQLPNGHGADAFLEALLRQVKTLPDQLRKSLTWDQGKEMAHHARFALATTMDVYFCDPHSPWQRGTSENTNGLLRQYFPKGTDLSVYSQPALDAVARELNDRPRQTLGWMKPWEKFAELVAAAA
jgi:IS30 family transposase